MIRKFNISNEYINLPLSVLGLAVLQGWVNIRSNIHEAIVIASIMDNLHGYVLKSPSMSSNDSPVDYLRKLHRYRGYYYDKIEGNTPLETIINIWLSVMSTGSENVEKWCHDNNIVYTFILDILNTINDVSLAYGDIKEVDMKLPPNTYNILEPLVHDVYKHLTMRWVNGATYESLYSIHNGNNTMSTFKADLDPEVVYYDDKDVGLSIPSGKEKPIYVSFMSPYLIPLGIDKSSGLIMSYLPLNDMPRINYMEYGLPYPV